MEREKPLRGAHSRFQAKLREVEDDLAQLRGARERMVAAGVKARELTEDLAAELTTHSSPDEMVTVICNGTGAVRQVILDSTRYNRVNEQQLCEAILQARHSARSQARREVKAIVGDAAVGI